MWSNLVFINNLCEILIWRRRIAWERWQEHISQCKKTILEWFTIRFSTKVQKIRYNGHSFIYKFICGYRKQDSMLGVSYKEAERKYNVFANQSLTVIDGAEKNRAVIFCKTPVEMPSDINLGQKLACVEIVGGSCFGFCNKIQSHVKMHKCK